MNTTKRPPTPKRARLAPSTSTIVVAALAGKGGAGDDDTRFQERSLCSVTAKTRQDGEEFRALAASFAIRPDIVSYPMSEAPRAPSEVPLARFSGATCTRRLKALNGERPSVTGVGRVPRAGQGPPSVLAAGPVPKKGSKVPGRCR